MAARISYFPSRNQKRTLRITILPNNWIGIFTPTDLTWIRSNVSNQPGVKCQFTLLRSRAIVDFPDSASLDKFMKKYREDFINS